MYLQAIVLELQLMLLDYLQATDTLFDDIHWLIVHSLKAAQVGYMYIFN